MMVELLCAKPKPDQPHYVMCEPDKSINQMWDQQKPKLETVQSFMVSIILWNTISVLGMMWNIERNREVLR